MIYFVAIIFISAFVQGMSGFGFSLVAMPFLTLFLPLQIIVPILVICSLVLNIIIFMRIKGRLHINRIVIMFIVGMMTTPLGVYLLRVVDEVLLKGLVGLLIVITAVIMMKGIHLEFSNKGLTYGMTGFLSGVLNGSVSLSGPPVVLMLVNEGEKKNDFKKNISAYFLALNVITIPSLMFSGLVVTEVINYSIAGIISLVVGALLGIKMGEKIDSSSFKKIVLLMIMTMGFMTLMSVFR